MNYPFKSGMLLGVMWLISKQSNFLLAQIRRRACSLWLIWHVKPVSRHTAALRSKLVHVGQKQMWSLFCRICPYLCTTSLFAMSKDTDWLRTDILPFPPTDWQIFLNVFFNAHYLLWSPYEFLNIFTTGVHCCHWCSWLIIHHTAWWTIAVCYFTVGSYFIILISSSFSLKIGAKSSPLITMNTSKALWAELNIHSSTVIRPSKFIFCSLKTIIYLATHNGINIMW